MSLKYQTDEDETQGRIAETATVAVRPMIPLYTTIFIASIMAVMAAQIAGGLDESTRIAGFVKLAFFKNHEYWRILTGATTHANLIHVGINCYAFYNIGRIFEMLSNRAHLAIVFLLSAIGGNILSLIFMPIGTSVGASGGIVGLLGYLAIYAFRRRQFISPQFRKSLLINIGFLLVFGIALYKVIDNFGHLGGLITGAVYGFIQIPSDEHVDPREASTAVEVAGLAALGVYIAACGFSILLILRNI